MKAVVLDEYGDLTKLIYRDVSVPSLNSNEVLLRMHATSINPADWKIRAGNDPFLLGLPVILGVDLVGTVEQVAAGVTKLTKGDRVMGMRVMGKTTGSYAEYATAQSDVLIPVPHGLSLDRAAALPLVALTGAQLVERAIKIRPGQLLLVTGAVGSVGRIAVHVAAKHGAKVIAGVRKQQREAASQLPVERIIALDDLDELESLADLDAVADTVGGSLQDSFVKALKDGGTYGSVVGKPKQDPGRNIIVAPLLAQPDANRLAELARDAATGAFEIPIAGTFPLSDIQEAMRVAEAGGAGGKIVIAMRMT